LLAVTLLIGLSLAVAGPLTSGAGTVYTMPQVLAALPAWRGRTVLVRGVLGSMHYLCPLGTSWHICAFPDSYFLSTGEVRALRFRVLPEPQDPILAALRYVHVLPPFLAETGVPRVYRVQILVHTLHSCVDGPPCLRAVLLDTLR
jgi:hypothetical protein